MPAFKYNRYNGLYLIDPFLTQCSHSDEQRPVDRSKICVSGVRHDEVLSDLDFLAGNMKPKSKLSGTATMLYYLTYSITSEWLHSHSPIVRKANVLFR